ncbi:MAG: ATP-grasp domain-containing protein [Gammaproteobacteria bacterium]
MPEHSVVARGTGVEPGPRVLLIAPPSSYRIAPFINAARRLGAQVFIASQGEHSLVSEVAAGLQIDLHQPTAALQRILAVAAQHSFAAVLGTDDSTVELASSVAQALGLRHNSPQAARRTRRKDLGRADLQRAGIPVPWFQTIDLAQAIAAQCAAVPFPCVLKPLAMAASRGVIRCDTPAQLHAACERVGAIIASEEDAEQRTQVLVEQFIPGREVALEGLLHDGELQVLALFDKPDPLDGPYFEETYYITPSRLDARMQTQVRDTVARACAAYGLHTGPVHAELRIHDEGAWILEVAARTVGGHCARLLRFGTGHGVEELVIAQALGRELKITAADGAAGVLMIPIPAAGVLRRVEGLLAAQRVPYIEDIEISVREGYELVPLPEGGSYLGFMFARAPTAELAEQALRAAHACLNIVIAPVWKLSN